MKSSRRAPVLFVLATVLMASAAFYARRISADTGSGAVSLTTPGSAYTQNFDSLSNTAGSTTNTTLPTGWYLTETGGGARDNEQYAVDTGSSNTGDTYSYGAAGSTERALGGLRSGTLVPLFGAKFTNNTGSTLTSLDVAYTGEEWRLGTASRTDQINFEISTDATDLSTGTYTGVAALNFVTPDTVTTGAKNGNAAGDRTALSSTITGLSIPNGASFFIRWTDTDASGADDGLSVDDFSITPNGGVPTPTLNINDVTLAEGNPPGTTTFTFAVTLSAPAGAGGVTFDIATADGTAQDGNPGGEDNDYVAQGLPGQSISAGSTGPYNFSVTVNRDTTPEPNETFFVNVTNITGANAGDTQGQGTITNDDVTLTPIHDIQGPGSSSPIPGSSVTTTGIVTGLKSNGFFIQEPDASVDADPATSEGIFVFTSSAPPAAAAIGNLVQVTATVQEFVPSSDPLQPPLTELASPTVSLLTSGNSLPTPVPLTATFPDPAGPFDQLERVESMRVSMTSLTVCGPTLGSVNEPNATATSSGVFFGVFTGVPRPFREAGIQQPDPPPSGTIPPIPRWDTNPEIIRVDSDGLVGGSQINVSTSTVLTGLVGPLDYGFRHYTILPDPGSLPMIPGGMVATPVTAPTSSEFTVGSYNLERFFDDQNDPAIGEPVLTTAAYQGRLAKASLGIRNYMLMPDVVGIVEMENLATLQALAAKISADAIANSQPDPLYQAFLVEGNDVGGIDVGFLVKSATVFGSTPRVTVNAVVQESKNTLFTNPDSSTELLNDRPPLRLDATINFATGASFPVQVIVNHMRSLNGVDDNSAGSNGWSTVGARVRAKRLAQAFDLANIVQTRQTNNPNERIILVGDFNFFEVNDGYVDSMSTILGTPVPDNQTVVPGDGVDLVNPDLSLILDTLLQRYSYNFDGSAQSLDHLIVNSALISGTAARRVEHPRINSDFPETDRNGSTTRLSDHDPLVGFFQIPNCTLTCPTNILTTAAAGQCSAVVTFAPTTGGTCGTITCAPPSGSSFNVGTTTVTCAQSGGSPSCSFTVTVTDTQSPTLGACPANITNQPAGANCMATVTFTPPTATDNCGTPTVTCTPSSGSSFPLGTTTVSCVAKDAANNMSSTCSFTVQVVDSTAPTLGACPTNITQPATTGSCAANVTFTPPTASDNCGTPTVTCTPASGSSFPLGTTTVSCKATDAANNMSSACTFTVTVTDTQAPTLGACPSNISVTGNGPTVVTYTPPTATDNCGSATVSCVPASGSSFPLGTTTVTCTASDSSPNSPDSTCSFTVTVMMIPCTITCPVNQVAWTSGTSAVVNYPAPTTSGGGCGTVTCTPASGSSFNVGTTTVTCSTTAGPSCSFALTVNRLTLGGTIADPLACSGPGNKVNGSFSATNTSGASATVSVSATLSNLVYLPNTATASQPGAVVVLANVISWTGTLGAGQSVTVSYMAQIADNATPNTQACSVTTATVSGNPIPGNASACLTINCPAVGPGGLLPAASETSDQKAGSILIYNVYTSGATNGNTQNTRINLTNTHMTLPAYVHLFFIAENCSVADNYVCLTANQTVSFLANDLDPGTTGYIVAVATNNIGCPVNFNYLIGDEYVKFAAGHAANLAAQAFSALPGGLPACDGNTVITTLNFDGVSYNRAPATLALDNIGSRADGNDTLLIVNRVGGNLGLGTSTLGTLFGLLYNDAENAVSFSVNGSCQLRGSLSNNFPRTTPRFDGFIAAGRTGWLRIYEQTGAVGLVGAAINFNPNASATTGVFNQGHNLHALTLTNSLNYVLPVFPPNC
ncbi:MAG: HYR domain-containing protein [Acidobacteria bacterium]|nr:HYR domain-containing protein [Acidobacteriota bacterium]